MKLETKSSNTWTATIFIAGQISEIERWLRGWVMRGACVTLEPCKYIFTGGTEDGARIGLIQYPRFEKPESELRDQAIDIATSLIEPLNQLSCTIVMSGETVWLYRPEKQASKLS